jgi:hypothetical protein
MDADYRKWFVMRISGERIKRTRLIQTDKYVVAVDVEMVIPADDPGEPCYAAETVKFLREVKERAERDELSWLQQHGKVYTAVGAA